MQKVSINMLSYADKVDGQGVGSAYLDMLSLFKQYDNDFNIVINSKEKTDIIHVHTVDPINYYRLKMSRAIKVISVHFLGDTLKGAMRMPTFLNNKYKKFVSSMYRKADYLVTVNPFMIDELVKNGFNREKIFYIPNCVTDEMFYELSSEEKNQIRDQYNLPKDRFIVLAVGQIVQRKGFLDFIEVAKRMPDVTFVWCGSFFFGKFTADYDDLHEAYQNPPSNVILLGQVPRKEMNNIYNAADAVFVPSYNETFGMVILEGACASKPIIARDLSIYPRLFFDNCLYGKDNDEFIKNIELLTNSKEHKKYKEKAEKIKDYYNEKRVFKLWSDFYHEIINREATKK